MKRITPEQVVHAYLETGLRPTQGAWFHNGCGCGVFAVCAPSFIGDPDDFDEPIAVGILGLPQMYMRGFTNGFDGQGRIELKSADWQAGYDDGKAAWKAVVAAGLVEE